MSWVVDSRIRNSADGNIQQQARRQVEIYQSKEPGRSLQVVRASQWSSSKIKDIKNSELLTTKTFDTPVLYESNKNTTNNYLQKRFNSDEDLILSSSSSSLLNEPSTSSSSSIFKRNSQIRRSLQLSKINNIINDDKTADNDNKNSSIKINKK
ncbi:uncharacterized protein LOC122857353, partial [Aphidius gifuensis]|uniref:uncharacterized protein LOC122857353 n=1 Tax=Aphidius gifuensis TaxID=684658 RepID=UPI001CDBD7E4